MIRDMKPLLLPFLSMLVALHVSSCGKKAQVKESEGTERKVSPSEAELYFNAHKEIRRAVNENNLPTLQRVLNQSPGIDLNQTMTDTGETLLIIAIKRDFRSIRNLLIEKGASAEKANINNETPLIAAVGLNMANSVRFLLDLSVNLEKRDANGDTALQIALKKSNDELALMLVKEGANVHSLDPRDRNAQKLANEFNVPETSAFIKTILEVETGTPDIAAFRTLVLNADHRRLTKVLSRYPRLATDSAYQAINPLALIVGVAQKVSALRTAELLLTYETNVNGPENAETTPLITATVSLKKGFANLYLSANANPQLLDKDGKSALVHAVGLNNLEMVELLLAYSAVETYTFRRDGRKITYDACDVARKAGRELTDATEKATNRKIRDALNCGFLNWLF
jgi:ankyrin repeat protein